MQGLPAALPAERITKARSYMQQARLSGLLSMSACIACTSAAMLRRPLHGAPLQRGPGSAETGGFFPPIYSKASAPRPVYNSLIIHANGMAKIGQQARPLPTGTRMRGHNSGMVYQRNAAAPRAQCSQLDIEWTYI